MRTLLLVLLLVPSVWAKDFDKTVRDLKAESRARRRSALDALATGKVTASTRSQGDRVERALRRFWSHRFTGQERATAVRALARLKRSRSLERLVPWLLKERDDRVLKEAEVAFAAAHEASVAVLISNMRRAKDPIAQAVLVRMLTRMPGEAARKEILVRARSIDPWYVRAAAALALARHRHEESFPPLMALLDRDDPGMVTAATETLTRLTGRKYGTDVAQWKAWWKIGGKTDPLKPKEPEKKKEEKNPEAEPDKRRYAHELVDDPQNPYYFGIRVRGRKVAFCYDISASMRYKIPLASDQLSRAIKGLPSGSMFEVIFFNEFVKPWRGRLSHADPVTKELLIRDLAKFEIKSYTNLFDSLELALTLDVDEVFVVSDGEPNRGRKQLPRDILNELKRINKRKIPIHTVSVVRTVDGDSHEPLLKRIADQTGGIYQERTLR